jgi:hypothetical protein
MIFFVLKYLMLEVIVRFVDIGGIVDHYWLMFNISFYNIVLDVFNGQINGYKIKITQDWSTVSDCCLTPREQVFSHNMARACYILMMMRTKMMSTLYWTNILNCVLMVLVHWNKSPSGRHVAPLRHHYPVSMPTSLCSSSLILHT